MSHGHDDRVADHQPGMCTAYGCPLHGSMSSSTNGGDDWSCSLHFGRDYAQMQAVTAAIHRHGWLAEVISRVRTIHPANPNRAADHRRAVELLAANNRMDLDVLRSAAGVPVETVRQWVNRLLPELEKLVLPEVEAPIQRTLPGQHDTWAKASAVLPNFA